MWAPMSFGGLGTKKNITPFPGFETRTVQLVAHSRRLQVCGYDVKYRVSYFPAPPEALPTLHHTPRVRQVTGARQTITVTMTFRKSNTNSLERRDRRFPVKYEKNPSKPVKADANLYGVLSQKPLISMNTPVLTSNRVQYTS